MKLCPQDDRRTFSESRRKLKPRDSTVMSTEPSSQDGSGLSLTLQPEILTRTPGPDPSGSPESPDVRVPVGGADTSSRPSSRRPRAGTHRHPHAHAHGHGHTHAHAEHEPDQADSDMESRDSGVSFSELRHLFHWVQRSLPFIIILCAKLVIQHVLGIAIGVGLFTTFLYVNKNIQAQVFLQGRRSKLQCFWLLFFLTASSLLLYYTFQEEALYYCLFLFSPYVYPLDFWEILWDVGVTGFILKFIFMGFKCLILLLPSGVMVYRRRGQWYMFIEEVGQVYQVIVPVPSWFRYLVSSQEVEGSVGFTLGVILALLYLVLKLLGFYGQWGALQKTVRNFLTYEVNGAPALQSQCSEFGDTCPICQVEFKQPRVLLCQHIFCDECITLWTNQEKTCPLCRTVITDTVHKWKTGATSPYLQIY